MNKKSKYIVWPFCYFLNNGHGDDDDSTVHRMVESSHASISLCCKLVLLEILSRRIHRKWNSQIHDCNWNYSDLIKVYLFYHIFCFLIYRLPTHRRNSQSKLFLNFKLYKCNLALFVCFRLPFKCNCKIWIMHYCLPDFLQISSLTPILERACRMISHESPIKHWKNKRTRKI